MPSPWEIDPLHLIFRLFLAVVLGGLIGLEREQHSHAAGFRTHILVCLGSALIMLLSAYGFSAFIDEENVRIDPARLAAQVISGIGFLGAGTILRNGLSISGLTTAASLWVVAAIGLSVGAGFYLAAVIACVMVLISLYVLHIVERKFLRNKTIRLLKITSLDQPGSLGKVSTALGTKGIDIRKVSIESKESGDGDTISIVFSIKIPKSISIAQVIETVTNIQGVYNVTVE